MNPGRRRLFSALAAAGCLAGYWAGDRLLGPFATVRRYGCDPQGHAWALEMPPGEIVWYLVSLLLPAAVWLLWRACSAADDAPPSMRDRRRTLAACVVLAVALSGFLQLVVLRGAPLTDDEMVYRFQAQTIADGRLTAPPPPATGNEWEPFQHIFLGVYRGHWFGQYSFGHPAILALGESVGIPGALGPLCAGLIVLLVYLLALRLFDERAALLAAMFAAISPLVLSTAATLASQNSSTSLILLGLLLTLKAVDSGRFAHALGAALALGAAFWCRQQEATLLGLGAIVLLLWRIIKGPSRLPLFLGGLLGSVLAIAPMAWLQYRLWGDPFWTNYQAYWWGYLKAPFKSPYGFGPAPWEIIHSPKAGLRATLQNLGRLDFFLLGVPLTGLAALAGAWKYRRKAAALAVFAGIPLTYLVLFFYFWPGLADTGPQLLHGAGTLLLLFAAAGLSGWRRLSLRPLKVAGAVALTTAATFWPAHLSALHLAARAGDEIPRLAANRGLDNAVVFVNSTPYLWSGGYERSWTLGRPMPRPDLSDPVLYLLHRSPADDKEYARRYFPDRDLYYLRLIDGKIALLPLDDDLSTREVCRRAQPRDLPAQDMPWLKDIPRRCPQEENATE